MQTPTPVSPALVHATCSDGLVRFPFHHFLSRGGPRRPLPPSCRGRRGAWGGARGGCRCPAAGLDGSFLLWCAGFPGFLPKGTVGAEGAEGVLSEAVWGHSPSRAERKWVQPCPPKPGLGRDLAFAALQACPLRGSRPPRGRLSVRSPVGSVVPRFAQGGLSPHSGGQRHSLGKWFTRRQRDQSPQREAHPDRGLS